jgi:predicted DNA-binding transcriptional regulator YafY
MARPNEVEAAKLQLSILSMLGEEREIPLSQIALRLGITEREAGQQMSALACCSFNPDAFVEIYNEDERGTVVVYGAVPELSQSVRLSASEARALDSALDFAGVASNDPLRKKLLDAAVSDEDRDALVRNFCTIDHGVDSAVIQTIALAIEKQDLVEFLHRNAADGRVTDRLVEPYNLLFDSGHWYLDGFCRQANALRTFRVDGISNIRDAGHYDERSLSLAAPAKPPSVEGLPLATLRVSRTSLQRGRYRWPGIAIVPDADDGSSDRVTVTVPYRKTTMWLAAQVASRATEVEVLDPPELAAQVRAVAASRLDEAREAWA